jgi:hypothetical protein
MWMQSWMWRAGSSNLPGADSPYSMRENGARGIRNLDTA